MQNFILSFERPLDLIPLVDLDYTVITIDTVQRKDYYTYSTKKITTFIVAYSGPTVLINYCRNAIWLNYTRKRSAIFVPGYLSFILIYSNFSITNYNTA